MLSCGSTQLHKTHITTVSSAAVYPSVAESKRGRRERRKRAGELGWRGDDEGGKGGGRGEKQRNVFSCARERERDRGTAVESVFILGKY